MNFYRLEGELEAFHIVVVCWCMLIAEAFEEVGDLFLLLHAKTPFATIVAVKITFTQHREESIAQLGIVFMPYAFKEVTHPPCLRVVAFGHKFRTTVTFLCMGCHTGSGGHVCRSKLCSHVAQTSFFHFAFFIEAEYPSVRHILKIEILIQHFY